MQPKNLVSSVAEKMFQFIAFGAAAIGFIFWLGFGIGTSAVMPGYAAVYIDDLSETYLAIPCIELWEQRKTKTIDLVRLSTAQDAWSRGYKVDDECRQTGAYAPSGRSLSAQLLERIGLLSPLEYWWDKPYRTEDGIVCPKEPGRKCKS